MSKEENVLKFYVLCNTLKDIVRTGWKDWNVNRDRIESIAEHIYGVQMLAIAMKYEYQYDVDIEKVIMMIAVHELEEIFIGDLTPFQITKVEKNILGHKVVEEFLKGLLMEKDIKKLVFEFDERKTREALFAHYCDKLECDLQCKLYDEEKCVDLTKQENNKTISDLKVKELLNKGMSWSEMWLRFSEKYQYDENFLSISNYAIDNNISKFKKC